MEEQGLVIVHLHALEGNVVLVAVVVAVLAEETTAEVNATTSSPPQSTDSYPEYRHPQKQALYPPTGEIHLLRGGPRWVEVLADEQAMLTEGAGSDLFARGGRGGRWVLRRGPGMTFCWVREGG
jgi:hypothetical protein